MCMMHGQLSWGSYCRPLGVRLWIEPLLQCRICMASGPQECTRLRWLSQSSKNEGHTCTNVQKTALSLSQVLIALPNKLLHGRKRWYFQNWIWSAKSLWTHYGTHTHTHSLGLPPGRLLPNCSAWRRTWAKAWSQKTCQTEASCRSQESSHAREPCRLEWFICTSLDLRIVDSALDLLG